MATITYETPASYDAALSSEVSAISDTASTAAGSAIDNSSSLDMLGDISILLATITPTSTGARVDIHLLPRLDDGTTYADIGTATIVGTLAITTGAGAKSGMIQGVRIPPGFFKLALTNRTGVTLNATGNTVKIRRYGLTVA